jgi:hypothetical protein
MRGTPGGGHDGGLLLRLAVASSVVGYGDERMGLASVRTSGNSYSRVVIAIFARSPAAGALAQHASWTLDYPAPPSPCVFMRRPRTGPAGQAGELFHG